MTRLLLMLLLLMLAGCAPQYGYTSLTRVDLFEQVQINTVDILLIVDDSCSMVEEQDKLARSFDSFIDAFDQAEADWRIGLVTTDVATVGRAGVLRGGEDELILADAEGRVLDRFAWSADWPHAPGAALQLDPGSLSPVANDSPGSWCLASAPYGSGDLGSPGQDNPPCEGEPSAVEPLPPEEARAPLAGDLVISELMIDPLAVPDALGEWVELRSLVGADLLLGGCTLSDEGENRFILPEGTVLPAGGHLLIAREADPALNGGLSPDLADPAAFTLADPVRILDPSLPDVAELFAELVSVGTGGSGIEMGLEAARLALSPEALAGVNAGFLRDEARLALIVVSDEEDSSPLSVAEYLLELGASKGDAAWRQDGMFSLSAIAGVDEPPYAGAPSCESPDAAATYASRYVAAATRTGGVLADICEEDFAPLALELGLVASGLLTELVLSEPASASSLRVRVYQDRDEDSLLYEAVQDLDYEFLPEDNAIRFLPASVPPSQSIVLVEYELLATGAGGQG